MNKTYLYYVASLFLAMTPASQGYTLSPSVEAYEHKTVAKIDVQIQTLQRGEVINKESILSKMRTKVGDPFSQLTLDQDLKNLSEEFDRAEPEVRVEGSQVYITIKLWQKPMIRSIIWKGNERFKTATLQKELDIKPYSVFNREEFNKAFNEVRDFFIKKGYFESELRYRIIPLSNSNEIDIEITVDEGRSGYIKKISFQGFTKNEQRTLLHMINTKKYNFFTSWLSGTGTYHEEALDHDKLIIINYLQNEGYADARVNIEVKESKTAGIHIEIIADRGALFHFGEITFTGNTLFSDEEIEQRLLIHSDKLYSPEMLGDTIQSIKDLYGSKGHIDAQVNYTLHLSQDEPIYNVHFEIEEGEEYRIGLIRVYGNTTTKTKVVLRESLLVPGEVFDSRKLKMTQYRLEGIGYFKSVNVYAVRTSADETLGENYRDVIIEVEETTTGNVNLFFGFSTNDSLFGGLNLTESNFDYRGLTKFWKEGLSALRGGGEYAQAKVSIGAAQQEYSIAWLTPYWNDTLWRVGFDASYTKSRLTSDQYHVDTVGFSLYGSFPITSYWTFGWKFRIRNPIVHVSKGAGEEARKQIKNSGLVAGFSLSIGYDSTDNPFKPHRGIRSSADAEIAGVRRHATDPRTFPFSRFGIYFTQYYPIWRKGTLKSRVEFKSIIPLGEGKAKLLPISERFFLGGDNTVRGYKPFHLGPKFRKRETVQTPSGDVVEDVTTGDPKGGITSTLVSVEYNQSIVRMLDVFVFVDGGAVSFDQLDIGDFQMSYGGGVRVDIGNRLPFMVGYGIPINPKTRKNKDGKTRTDEKRFFFSMGGQF